MSEAPAAANGAVATPAPPAIEASGLAKRYRPDLTFPRLLNAPLRGLFALAVRLLRLAKPRPPELDDLSFSVPPGAVVGFLGPNGAGKTTTMKIVANLLAADRGAAFVHGHPVTSEYDRALRRLGCMIGEPHLYPYLTGRQNLRLAAFFHPGVDDDRIDAVLDLVGMREEADKKFGDCSTGMKKRLALAFALAHRPDVLVLDEPSSGLDPRGRAELRDLVLRVSRAEGVTVFISSHELVELDRVCDRLVIIERGRRVAEGSVEELRGRFAEGEAHAAVRVVCTPDPATASFLAGLEFVREAKPTPDGYRLVARRDALGRLAPAFVGAGIELRGFIEEAGSIEDIYLKATGPEGGAR